VGTLEPSHNRLLRGRQGQSDSDSLIQLTNHDNYTQMRKKAMRLKHQVLVTAPIPGHVPPEAVLAHIQTFTPLLKHNAVFTSFSEIPPTRHASTASPSSVHQTAASEAFCASSD
ncbi:hypothetical protein NXS19_000247, partial [Fusarium pseudograminearum]